MNVFISLFFCGGVGSPDAVPFPNMFFTSRDNIILKYSDFFFKSKTVSPSIGAVNPCISLLNRPSVNKRYRIDSQDVQIIYPAKRARLDVASPTFHKDY